MKLVGYKNYPNLFQHAVGASLSSGAFHVVVTWRDAETCRPIWTIPSFNIPAVDLDHAWRIADAINSAIVTI